MSLDHFVFVGINILLAWSCYIILLSGQISLGNSAFMAIGAYVSGVLTVKIGMSLILSLIVGSIIAVVIGVLIGLPAIRTKGVYLIMVTLGVATSVEILIQNIDYLGGVQGFGGMYGTSLTMVYSFVIIVGIMLWVISKSPLQRIFEAVREDERVAASMGIHVTSVKLMAFGLGAGVSALAGGLYAHHMTFVAPEHFGIWASISMLLYVILGGTNNMWGPVLGAAVMTLLPEYIRFLDEWRITVFGLLVLIMLLFRPEGLLTYRTLTFSKRVVNRKKLLTKAGEISNGNSAT
jgi:branched-chain amino acid transport system permease protein